MYKLSLLFSSIIFTFITAFGQAGIGSTPTTVAGIGPGKLDITGVGDFTLRLKGDDFVGFGIQSFRNNGSDHAMINLFGSRGTMSSPSAILSGDIISTISSRAYTGSGFTPITSIQSYYTGTNQGAITFSTNGGSSTTERMRINHDGNVGIGTATPTSRLNIAGGGIKIHNGFTNNTSRPSLTSSTIGNFEIRGVGSIEGSTQEDAGNDGFLRLSAGGGTSTTAQSSIDLSGYSNQPEMNNNIVMRTAGSERLRITNDGRVGIGTASPAVALHVASFVTQYVTSYGFLSTGGAGSGTFNQNINYSIQADQRIRAPEFNAISDARIKNNISKLNTANTLTDLNKLRVVNYSYVDQLANGNKNKTGFIAQEVEGVNSQFVNQSADFIPSVFALAKSVSLVNDLLQVTTAKPHDFLKGDIVKFFAGGKKEIIMTIESIENPQTFSVKGWDESTNNLFIYGKKVEDFKAIDFDQITALSVGAIQELNKKVDRLEIENDNMRKLIKSIEIKLLELKAEIRK